MATTSSWHRPHDPLMGTIKSWPRASHGTSHPERPDRAGTGCSPMAGPVSTVHGLGCGGSRPRSGQNARDSGDSDATPDPHPNPHLGWAAPPPGHSLTEGSRLFEAPGRRNFPLTNPSSLSTRIVHALEPKRETFLMESPHFPSGEAEAWGG